MSTLLGFFMMFVSYARYSTDNQRDTSVEDQHFQNIAKFKALGIPEDRVTKISDKGISAAHADRPGYQQISRAVEADGVKILIVNDQSRWTRDLDIGDWLNKFEFHGTRFICSDDGFDSEVEGTEISAQYKGIQNHQFLKDHGKKVRRGLDGRARDPHGNAGDHCYGYVGVWKYPDEAERFFKNGAIGPKPERTVVIDAAPAEIITRIHTEFVSGVSMSKIAIRLNDDKVPLPPRSTAKEWSAGLVSHILKNKKYAGIWERRNRVKTYKGKRRNKERSPTELIVTNKPHLVFLAPELLEGAKKRFKEIKEMLGPNTGKCKESKLGKYARLYPFNLLSHRLFCSECGSVLHRASGNGGHFYRCQKCFRKAGCSSKSSVSKPKAEEVILTFLQDKLDTNLATI